ncbi:MAG: NAD-binding protein, partial [Nodosilinea sp.]
AILLTERGISGGDAIKALVFLTIILTVFLQGLTARLVARWLGITKADAVGAVIVGCSPLSLLIARLLKEYGDPVMMIDTNEDSGEAAKKEGIDLLVSSALDSDALEKVGLDKAGTFLAMTKNGEVNAVVAQRALEEFQPARVIAVLPKDKSLGDLPNQGRLKGAQTPSIAFKKWNTHLNDGDVRLGETRLRHEDTDLQKAHLATLVQSGSLLPLLVERDDALRVMLAREAWEAGDRIIYLWHDSKPKLLKQLAGGIQPARLTLETVPIVEIVPPQPKDSLPKVESPVVVPANGLVSTEEIVTTRDSLPKNSTEDDSDAAVDI